MSTTQSPDGNAIPADGRHARTEALIGDGAAKLRAARVLVVGLGGVGGYCFETLVRAGVGSIVAVDGDRVDITNLNRQILADITTVGRLKTEAAAERAARIDPELKLTVFSCRFDATTADRILEGGYDCVADAIDSVADKVLLISECHRRGIPIISAMGAGNRLDDDFVVTDIYDTKYDGLARAVRTRLKREGIKSLTVIASPKPPLCGSVAPASISYPPAVAGCKLGGEVIRRLLR